MRQKEVMVLSEYLSLVAKSEQVNTPPGSYETVKKWIHEAFIGRDSCILEVGCSSGFISIELARYAGARSIGLDLHAESLQAARGNIDSHVSGQVAFLRGDAARLPFKDHRFTHGVVGGHLPFIPSELRRAHVEEMARVIRPWGYLCTAAYFYKESPPENLLLAFNREVGTRLSADSDLKYWTDVFSVPGLILEYESLHEVIPSDAARIEAYVSRLSSREEWRRKLRLFNENGRYLGYFVRVYRRIPEGEKLMLQIPRGGIYLTRETSSRRM